MQHITDKQIEATRAACGERHVANLYLFGSVLKPNFNAQSDIDLLVIVNTK